MTRFPDKPIPEIFALTCKEADQHLTIENGISSGSTFAAAFLREEVRDGKKVQVVYTANAGDTRIVLSSAGGKALRLTRDHKGSDPEEAQRVREAGGFIMMDRVMGTLPSMIPVPL